MPDPLSMICKSVLPASLTISVIEVAPASMAFSMSSFTAEAGRCTTSPAAIWLAIESGRSWIMSGIKKLGQLFFKLEEDVHRDKKEEAIKRHFTPSNEGH